ncbi:MAG TPA: hypothetical protein VFH77_18645 [Streptomyces sp.]|jgi:hypothetical protein|nr:hypothetical protein [Streptomyces sp.]
MNEKTSEPPDTDETGETLPEGLAVTPVVALPLLVTAFVVTLMAWALLQPGA